MKVSMEFNNKLTKVSEIANDSIFQELEYDELNGIRNGDIAEKIYYFNKLGVRVRQVRIILEESGVRLRPDILSYLKGEVFRKGKSAKTKVLNIGFSENNYSDWPVYFGNGDVFLRPSYGFFVFLELEDEEIIIKESIMCACEENVYVKEIQEDNEDKLRLSGSGIVVLELPVPENEVFRCKLYEDNLKVNGNLVILRGGNVSYSMENSALAGEDGLIRVYRGIGDVWLIPTRELYHDMKRHVEENE